MSVILDPAPRTRLARIVKSRSKMVDRIAVIEQRLAVLPVLGRRARCRAPQEPGESGGGR